MDEKSIKFENAAVEFFKDWSDNRGFFLEIQVDFEDDNVVWYLFLHYFEGDEIKFTTFVESKKLTLRYAVFMGMRRLQRKLAAKHKTCSILNSTLVDITNRDQLVASAIPEDRSILRQESLDFLIEQADTPTRISALKMKLYDYNFRS